MTTLSVSATRKLRPADLAADKLAGGPRESDPPPAASPLFLRFFLAYNRRYLRKHFHAVRVAREGSPPALSPGPLLVYLNHPSWWDPLVGLLLAERFFGDRSPHAPIDAAQLERYRIFRKLGFYGVDKRSPGGVRSFLRVSDGILRKPRAMIWLTPQGRFVDARQTDAAFERGLAMLVRRHPEAQVLPVALEYVFWNDRLPEILVRFGDVSRAAQLAVPNDDLDAVNRELVDRLARLQDQLAADSARRDPERFVTCAHGAAGVGGVYDWFRRARAWCRGRTFNPEHGTGSP